MGLKVIPPTFVKTSDKARSVSRSGVILLEFAPVGAGPREYDWSRKASFSLSPTECGEILAMDQSKGVEFFHDPNMGDAEAGKVTKKLKLTPTMDMKGMFLGVQVSDKSDPGASASYSIPITLGELAVVRSLMQFSIPRMMAFDTIWSDSGAGGGFSEAPVPPPAPLWS